MKARYTVGGRGVSSREARVHVRRRDGHDCWICQAPVVEGHPHGSPEQASLDHVIERAAGGSSEVGNLRLAHAGCNGARGERFNLEHGDRIRREHRERRRAVSDAVCQRTRAMNAVARGAVQTGMTSPIRIVSMGEDAYAITGLSDHDVQVHVSYRVDNDPTETRNYHASIDGLPSYEARGETEPAAADALCSRLRNDLMKPPPSPGEASGPEALLAYLADCERVRHEEGRFEFGSPSSIESLARQEAYRAAAQIVRAARVLAEPTAAQRRLWANMARAHSDEPDSDGTVGAEAI